MKVNEILAISGYPGLYRYVANNRNGIIIESIVDERRLIVPQTAKVSSLGDIAIFTVADDVALTDVFQMMADTFETKETISHKSDDKLLKEIFEKALPDYDKDRVRISDIKKIISWYNLLIKAGVTSFKVEEEQEESTEE